jgi:hypothetical protein
MAEISLTEEPEEISSEGGHTNIGKESYFQPNFQEDAAERHSEDYNLPESYVEKTFGKIIDTGSDTDVDFWFFEKLGESMAAGAGGAALAVGFTNIPGNLVLGTGALTVAAYRGNQLTKYLSNDKEMQSLEQSAENLLEDSENLTTDLGYSKNLSSESISDIYGEILQEWSELNFTVSQILVKKDDSNYELSVYCEDELQFTFEGENEELNEFL